MFKVELKNLNGVMAWGATFEEYDKALAWTTKQLTKPGRLQGNPEDFIKDITVEHNLNMQKIAAKKYLAETDWYITANVERGKVIPEDVKQARLNAINILNS